MEKIRTTEQLIDFLDRSIVWRRSELSTIRKLINASPLPEGKKECLIRAGIALLYAHWEGFVKEAATAYISFIATRRMRYDELATNFLALAMKQQLNEARETNKATVYSKVANFFLTGLSERANIDWLDSINTNSNLSSDVLREILFIIGIDYGLFETKAKLIDVQLLRNRNSIAHGEYLLVDEEEFESIYEQVLNMMVVMNNEISNAAVTEKYKKII